MKSSYVIFKNCEKKRSNKTKRSDIKYFLTIHFLTKTTKKCANFVHVLLVLHFKYFLLVFRIYTAQQIKCTYLKYELNRFYNGGGGVYVLKSELSRLYLQYVYAVPFLVCTVDVLKMNVWFWYMIIIVQYDSFSCQ